MGSSTAEHRGAGASACSHCGLALTIIRLVRTEMGAKILEAGSTPAPSTTRSQRSAPPDVIVLLSDGQDSVSPVAGDGPRNAC